MEKTVLCLAVLLTTLLHQSVCRISDSPLKVFYVKPTVPRTECPSGDSPCHSLQCYANHSNFTSNSRFLFLEGEHHLDSVVTISNVANLSLVGASPGVEILCNPAGNMVQQRWFQFVNFSRLSMGNMAIGNCSTDTNIAISLTNGSEVSFNQLMSNNYSMFIDATNVVGLFSVTNSTFLTPSLEFHVSYSSCDGPCHFRFSNNSALLPSNISSKISIGFNLNILVSCLDVVIEIMDSLIVSKNGLHVLFSKLKETKNSLLVSNAIFREAIIDIGGLYSENCGYKSVYFTGVTFINTVLRFINMGGNCSIIIENSAMVGPYVQLQGREGTNFNVIFHNVTIANSLSFVPPAVLYSQNASLILLSCTFQNNSKSVLQMSSSKLVFEGHNLFYNNSAPLGGAIQLLDSSTMFLRPNASITFEKNHADYVGGAIYIGKNSGPCFFHVESQNFDNSSKVYFVNNTANISGSSLYGIGCDYSFCGSSCTYFDNFEVSNTEADPSAIASDPPIDVCLCDSGKRQPNSLAHAQYSTNVFPGQEFPIRLAVISTFQRGVVPGEVRAFSVTPQGALGENQLSQASSKPYCEDFYYSARTTEEKATFLLTIKQSLLDAQLVSSPWLYTYCSPLNITVHLMDCPVGFSLSPTNGTCACDPMLDGSGVQCIINNQSFLRPTSSWIGFIDESPSNMTGVMFHPNCPIGYCSNEVSITSNTSDSQCQPHRTGLLCGECEEGYSLTLGDGKCAKCSNTYLLLVLPFAVAGLLLVAVLFALNLTVTEGSINGLIFYTNVIALNHNVLFTGQESYLYPFVAWLNLDLGISSCLYNGMDGYAETWFQFVFPIYLWAIILVIIQLYRKFPRLANRLGGENAVKVLATLLLLSYTKLQRTVVTIMSFTRLEYPGGVVRYVWLYDANLEFFRGKHLYLGIAGILVLVFLIVPYTLCLTFFQQLQACSGCRLFQWVNKLKPVFDSYAGPYKDKYRFWTGLLLVVRTLLIILFTINTAGSVDVNLLIISVVSIALLMAHSNGTYKKWPYNYLESFFYLQLGVFAAAVAYIRLSNHGSITAVADTSFGLTLIIFLTVMGYHFLHRLAFFKKHYYQMRGFADIDEEDLSVVHDRE